MYLVKKKLKDFSSAHRVLKGYQGKCQHLHGHNYVSTVLIGAEVLDPYDFVIDFNDVKRICDDWIETYFDHATLVSAEDQILLDFVIEQKQKYYLIPGNKNSTVEVLAEHLFEEFSALFAKEYPHIKLLEVEIAETPNSKVIYRK
ncbi:MAG: 6-carboxytetrahydropterin synthase [Gammaproteobacteria bacterium]|jgi:6-pyruvoyltetrahydropterin/6-carboxytetrahydropterin synthase|nr:6-carboxytetrahydropterin synthase [Gammaproteobacteria bacterium]